MEQGWRRQLDTVMVMVMMVARAAATRSSHGSGGACRRA
jgi:hypothetical protein